MHKQYRKNMDYNSYEAIEGQGCIFTGQAGSRKTTLLCDVVMKTDKSLVLAFTNKAIVNVKERLEREEANDICYTHLTATFLSGLIMKTGWQTKRFSLRNSVWCPTSG